MGKFSNKAVSSHMNVHASLVLLSKWVGALSFVSELQDLPHENKIFLTHPVMSLKWSSKAEDEEKQRQLEVAKRTSDDVSETVDQLTLLREKTLCLINTSHMVKIVKETNAYDKEAASLVNICRGEFLITYLAIITYCKLPVN